MPLPLFYPPTQYTQQIEGEGFVTLAQLCASAGAPCKASGAWTQRRIFLGIDIRSGCTSVVTQIQAEPGYAAAVKITGYSGNAVEAARLALGALAYGLMDGVARQSILGASWNQLQVPLGRPKSGRARSQRQRQRKYRSRLNEGNPNCPGSD